MSNILNTYYAMYENLYTRQHVFVDIILIHIAGWMIKKTRIKLGWTLETHWAFFIIVECYVYLFGTMYPTLEFNKMI